MVSTDTVIETSDLSKNYKKIRAVDGLTMQVPRGVVVGFLGPNGAGKTTTMRILMGLVKPAGGSATMLGVPVDEHTAEIRRRIGTLIESPFFYPTHTGRTNLRIQAKLAGVADNRVDSVLEIVELSGRAKSKYSTYSLGMKQRLGIANALLTDPELMLLDEPTNGLDPAGIVEIRKLLRNLTGDGRTVFVSSHLLAEIKQECDYVIILNKGRQVACGSVSDLVAKGRELVATVPDAGAAVDVLKRANFNAISKDDSRVAIEDADGRAADVNKALSEQGIYASELIEQDQTLEQVFLQLTDSNIGGEDSG